MNRSNIAKWAPVSTKPLKNNCNAPVVECTLVDYFTSLCTTPLTSDINLQQGLCFVEPLPDYLICPICLFVFHNPVNLSGCAHVLCADCFKRCQKNECPTCRAPALNNYPSILTKQVLCDRLVRCRFGVIPKLANCESKKQQDSDTLGANWELSGGCSHVMPVEELAAHELVCVAKKFFEMAFTPTIRAESIKQKQQLVNMSKQIDENNAKSLEREKYLKKLKNENLELTKQKERAEISAKSSNEEATELRQKNSNLLAGKNKLENELKKWKKDLKDCERAKQEAIRIAEEKDQVVASMDLAMGNLRNERSKLETDLENLNLDHDFLRSKVVRCYQEKDNLIQKILVLRKEKTGLESDVRNLELMNGKLKGDYVSAKNETSRVIEERNKMKNKFVEFSTYFESLKFESLEMASKNEALGNENRNLKKDLKQNDFAKESMKKMLWLSRMRNEKLRDEVSVLEEAISLHEFMEREFKVERDKARRTLNYWRFSVILLAVILSLFLFTLPVSTDVDKSGQCIGLSDYPVL